MRQGLVGHWPLLAPRSFFHPAWSKWSRRAPLRLQGQAV
jgi:hypothetical protein